MNRHINGMVLPWNTPGKTSSGSLKVNASAITYPENPREIKLLRDHSNQPGYTPVGYATSVEEKEDGLFMSFAIGKTEDGDRALTDVTEGIRDAFSVELVDVERDNDTVTAAHLTAVALVAIPAFSAARVEPITPTEGAQAVAFSAKQCQITASQNIDADDADDSDEDNEPESDEDSPTTPDTDDEENTPMDKTTAARAPQGLNAINEKPALTFAQAIDTIKHVRMGTETPEMTAALADIKRSANPSISAPAWLGKLWDGTEYSRRIVPTFTQKTLTDLEAVGWRWKKKPEVADYEGDKAEIPTGTVSTEEVKMKANRMAAGHDIDRAYFDFNRSDFLQAFFQARVNDYAYKTDIKAAQFAVAEAKKGKAITGAEPDLLHAAARARMEVELRVHQEPDTYLVNPKTMFGLFKITNLDNPAYLDLLGVDPKKFVSSEHVPENTLIAYPKQALSWYELAGSPIRVDAQRLDHGGIDSAVFGYWAALSTHPDAVVSVSIAPATAGDSSGDQVAA
ncbi:hypothetical protein [Corynebacterium propinquum]|uniref:hypothetical protein n=1 Tax=Corynebacterium propinquum TaxID=43769 RepID=UPI003B638BE3